MYFWGSVWCTINIFADVRAAQRLRVWVCVYACVGYRVEECGIVYIRGCLRNRPMCQVQHLQQVAVGPRANQARDCCDVCTCVCMCLSFDFEVNKYMYASVLPTRIHIFILKYICICIYNSLHQAAYILKYTRNVSNQYPYTRNTCMYINKCIYEYFARPWANDQTRWRDIYTHHAQFFCSSLAKDAKLCTFAEGVVHT